MPGNIADADYGPGHFLVWPCFGVGLSGVADPGMANVSQPVTYDKVPFGDVAVRRGEKVHARDGDIGRVEGLVIDARDRQVTHVLLQEGHLLGRKEVAIPIGAVIAVDDGIRLNITKQEVKARAPVLALQVMGVLPRIDHEQWNTALTGVSLMVVDLLDGQAFSCDVFRAEVFARCRRRSRRS